MSTKTSPAKAAVKMPVESPEMARRAMNLREQYISLTKVQQELVVHWFNLHNAAGCIYNECLNQDARDYIDLQVKYSQEMEMMQRVTAGDDGSGDNEEFVDRLNDMLDNEDSL